MNNRKEIVRWVSGAFGLVCFFYGFSHIIQEINTLLKFYSGISDGLAQPLMTILLIGSFIITCWGWTH